MYTPCQHCHKTSQSLGLYTSTMYSTCTHVYIHVHVCMYTCVHVLFESLADTCVYMYWYPEDSAVELIVI